MLTARSEVGTKMRTVATIAEMRQIRQQLAGPVGFVATMGYFHEGHLSLVRRARAENASVVVSIFVNPAQFGPREDFKSYPRSPERDLALLEKEQTDIAFMPAVAEVYPPGFNSWVEVGQVTERLEGASRPGHFRGVATVVAKLFHIVAPRKMVADLAMNPEVITLPTVREADGLAISSRNAYLDPRERQAATVLYRALMLAQQSYSGGERDAEYLRHEMRALIRQEPLATIDYVSIADAGTLEELDEARAGALALLAVAIGKTRLDNVVLE
jgi:pantoate--beta-alanine ligase